jgi:hypothetical protein
MAYLPILLNLIITKLRKCQEILNNLAFSKFLIRIMIKKDSQKYLNSQEKVHKESPKHIILIVMINKILKLKIYI